jgi:hypothetical protein
LHSDVIGYLEQLANPTINHIEKKKLIPPKCVMTTGLLVLLYATRAFGGDLVDTVIAMDTYPWLPTHDPFLDPEQNAIARDNAVKALRRKIKEGTLHKVTFMNRTGPDRNKILAAGSDEAAVGLCMERKLRDKYISMPNRKGKKRKQPGKWRIDFYPVHYPSCAHQAPNHGTVASSTDLEGAGASERTQTSLVSPTTTPISPGAVAAPVAPDGFDEFFDCVGSVVGAGEAPPCGSNAIGAGSGGAQGGSNPPSHKTDLTEDEELLSEAASLLVAPVSTVPLEETIPTRLVDSSIGSTSCAAVGGGGGGSSVCAPMHGRRRARRGHAL